MSRARTLAGAIGSDGALNVADVAGLAAVASSGSASDLSTGTLPLARLPNTGYELGFKNLFINGDARISQRNESNAITTMGQYPADRWYTVSYTSTWGGANTTCQRIAMPVGTLLGGEYFGNFMRLTPASDATKVYFWQHIENLQQFDSRTITLSYWARVGTGTFSPTAGSAHRFEFSHDSASTTTDVYGNNPTYTTTWQKFTTTITVPSFSGKTFGPNSYLSVTILSAHDFRSNSYIDFTGLQLEFGSVATPFERRHIGLEWQMCLRYFWMVYNSSTYSNRPLTIPVIMQTTGGSGSAACLFQHPVYMRTAPSISFSNATQSYLNWPGSGSVPVTSVGNVWGTNNNQHTALLVNYGGGNASFVPGSAMVLDLQGTSVLSFSAEI